MNKAIKKKWLKALRSGKYKQGSGALRNEHNMFCCLGVLCNLHAEAHPRTAAKQNDPERYMEETGLPPRAVLRWAGIHHKELGVSVTYKGKLTTLVDLNDAHDRLSFKQIANVIERCL